MYNNPMMHIVVRDSEALPSKATKGLCNQTYKSYFNEMVYAASRFCGSVTSAYF